MLSFKSFPNAINYMGTELIKLGKEVKSESWQGIKIPDTHKMLMIRNADWEVPVPEDLELLRNQIQPDLPWADDHFKERIGGVPLNPGEQYKNWKFFKNSPGADEQFRKQGGKFSHTYMERMWPKRAASEDTGDILTSTIVGSNVREGIRYVYGDYQDVLLLLLDEPHTRQAFLPIWFPEDTGAVHRQRVPCTLGYLFQLDEDRLHINYYIRACDAFKHFRNDIYLTARLLLWTLNELRMRQSSESTINWHHVKPGILTFYCANFHVFIAEKNRLYENSL